MTSCVPARIEDPIESVFVNFDRGITRSGPVNFNYTVKNRNEVGAWAVGAEIKSGTIDELSGTYYCQSVKDFGEKVIPTLRKGHDQYYDWIENN